LQIDDFVFGLWDLNIQGESIAFSTNGDVCIATKFDPDFSNALGVKVTSILLLLAFLIVKFA
jgi:hypothetical protein